MARFHEHGWIHLLRMQKSKVAFDEHKEFERMLEQLEGVQQQIDWLVEKYQKEITLWFSRALFAFKVLLLSFAVCIQNYGDTNRG